MTVDKAYFFERIRSSLFKGALSQTQIAAMDAIIDSFTGSLDQLAYILATPIHEVGTKLEPISENLNYTAARLVKVFPSRFKSIEAAKPFEKNPEALANKVYGGRYGNALNEGWRYRGRGYCQITFKDNYAKFGLLMSLDLVSNPDLALKPAIAARILVVGMRDGLFTGKKLSDYIGLNKRDYVNARRIINADVAANGAKIAAQAEKFREALRETTPETVRPVALAATSSIPVSAPSTTPQPKNAVLVILAVLASGLGALGKALGWF
jgi:putative chitinase